MLSKDSMIYKDISIEDTIKLLDVSLKGLTETEASKRLALFGENRIREQKKHPLIAFFSRYWGPMPWLLELAMLLSFIVGHYIEVIIIFILLTLNVIIGFIHDRNSQKALEYLKTRLAIKAKILRDGKWILKDSFEIVPGDVFSVELGDVIPADSKIITGELSVDQSALTGESFPAKKQYSDILFSGSMVMRGEAKCLAVNTGFNTYFGKTIELVKIAKPKSHQEELLLTINKYMLYIGIVALVFVTINALFLKKDFLTIITFAAIFLIGSVPIALPAVFTIVQSVGAKELAKKDVLVTKLESIEDAASMNVLCIDKTGTITQNKLSIIDIVSFSGYSNEEIIKIASLASTEESKEAIDLLIIDYAKTNNIDFKTYKKIEFTPFDPSIKRSEAIIETNGKHFKVIKGFPPIVLTLCTDLDEETRVKINNTLKELSTKGYRTLGIAISKTFDFENIQFIGIITFADPIRNDSKEMIEEVKSLGIKPIMLTGDSLSIAKEVASKSSFGNKILQMNTLREMINKNQVKDIENIDGVAEIYPEDKFKIVKFLQSIGHVVGMTGDGVNDAPALKQAEMGIAVSNSTDAAKASADIVLITEGLGGINDAIKISRKIYQRMLSWVINKVSKVIQIIGILVVAFFWLDYIIISLLGIVLIMFANDFVTISLATDNVKHTPNPNYWNVKKIMLSSSVIGILLVIQGLIAINIGLVFFQLDIEKLSAFIILLVIFSSQFRAYIVRERRHFWSSKPCKELILSTSAAIVIFIFISLYGLIIPSLTLSQIIFILIYSLFTFSIDLPKYFIFRKTGL